MAADEERGDAGHVDVVTLALGPVDGHQRAEVAAHLRECADCRSEYEELAGVVAELLPAVPAVQPPLGFDERALRRLGVGPRDARRRPWRVIVVAAAAVVALALAGAWFATRSTDTGGALAELELTNGGAPVGTVSISEVEGTRVMVVAIVEAPDDVSYTCRLTLSDGTVVESDAWPAGAGAWIVPLPADGRVTTVDVVVSGTDKVWSAARF